MAESEPKSEIQDESLKGSSISATLNGHSSIPKEEVKKMNHTENLENGEPECKSPQVNGDISDKSSLDNCELSKSDIDSCELPKSDSVCITKDSNKELNESDNISQNGKVISCTDIDSKTIASDNNDSVDKIVTNSEIKISNKSSSSSNTEKVEKGERSNDTSTMKSEEKSDIVQSVDKVIETKSDNQTNDELEEEKSLDKSNNDSKKPEDDKSKTVSEKGEKESKEVIEEAGEKKEAEKSEDLDDKAKKSETSTAEEGKTSTAEEGKTSTAEEGGSGKDNSNVIIIDTNTLIKGQGGMSTHHSNAQSKITSNVSAQTTVSTNATANIQTAIQTITGGNPAMQGLQSAYLNAIQQVLVAQGGTSVSNPHYIATLQQYYNTLGALQDDAYVIEAPSFIVPYVMEGKPVVMIKI
ncbi:hypothetical protein Avbf_04923 [Armadillidium vulgare]|nr:hypothetical protein Avbf_04923 [Armadillidium vulgare]